MPWTTREQQKPSVVTYANVNNKLGKSNQCRYPGSHAARSEFLREQKASEEGIKRVDMREYPKQKMTSEKEKKGIFQLYKWFYIF